MKCQHCGNNDISGILCTYYYGEKQENGYLICGSRKIWIGDTCIHESMNEKTDWNKQKAAEQLAFLTEFKHGTLLDEYDHKRNFWRVPLTSTNPIDSRLRRKPRYSVFLCGQQTNDRIIRGEFPPEKEFFWLIPEGQDSFHNDVPLVIPEDPLEIIAKVEGMNFRNEGNRVLAMLDKIQGSKFNKLSAHQRYYVWYLRGEAYRIKEDNDQAIRCYKESLKHENNPNLAAHNELQRLGQTHSKENSKKKKWWEVWK